VNTTQVGRKPKLNQYVSLSTDVTSSKAVSCSSSKFFHNKSHKYDDHFQQINLQSYLDSRAEKHKHIGFADFTLL
jgi:hypothetical protein